MSRVTKLEATHDGQAKYQGINLYELFTKIIINAQALVAKYCCVVIGGLLFVGLGGDTQNICSKPEWTRNAFKPATHRARSAYINHHTFVSYTGFRQGPHLTFQ